MATINRIKRDLAKLPLAVAHHVAKGAAPALTDLARTAYRQGRTVYGTARAKGVDGRELSLRRTGATESSMQFAALGRLVRCELGTRWARYLVGRYRILPMGRMPLEWTRRLDAITKGVRHHE